MVQSGGVAVLPCALVSWGVCWPAGHPFVVSHEGGGSAYVCNMCSGVRVPRGTTGLSKHGDPVFLHFRPLPGPCQDGGGGLSYFAVCVCCSCVDYDVASSLPHLVVLSQYNFPTDLL